MTSHSRARRFIFDKNEQVSPRVTTVCSAVFIDRHDSKLRHAVSLWMAKGWPHFTFLGVCMFWQCKERVWSTSAYQHISTSNTLLAFKECRLSRFLSRGYNVPCSRYYTICVTKYVSDFNTDMKAKWRNIPYTVINVTTPKRLWCLNIKWF